MGSEWMYDAVVPLAGLAGLVLYVYELVSCVAASRRAEVKPLLIFGSLLAALSVAASDWTTRADLTGIAALFFASYLWWAAVLWAFSKYALSHPVRLH